MSLTQDLFTSKELLIIYDPSGSTGTTANGLARELRRAGVPQVLQGNAVRLVDGSQVRLYAIRNSDKWVKETKPNIVVDHLSGVTEKKEAKKRKKY